MAGYGAAQAVPGPLFTFAAYLGAVMHEKPNGIAGAALALMAIFLGLWNVPARLVVVIAALGRCPPRGAVKQPHARRTSTHSPKGDLMRTRMRVAVVAAAVFLAAPGVWLAQCLPVAYAADAEIAQLKAEIEQLKGRLPSQSHAMMDVGYHFTNLWFAGQKKNWPLAQFYLNETRSHLRWAVRIIPVRRIPGGEIDLRGLLEALDSTGLAEISKAIADKNTEGFTGAYRHTLEGCYSCHKASDKPYLRPRIPEQPESRIIDFDPAATWP